MKKMFIIGSTVILLIGSVIGFRLYKYYNYSGELIGIRGTYTYHRDNCAFVKKASADKLIFIDSLKEAAEHEYRSCKSCNPPANDKYVAEIEKQKQLVEKERLSKVRQDLLDGKSLKAADVIELYEKGFITKEEYDKYESKFSVTTSRYSLPE
ncbi:Ada metal-binding domain-containing protein [Pseudobacteroides cellulosolvens]|uniref:Ada metal-binding domain-containing protein n=1 Tax=Pseudobacteroides cellulosolvens ATCC 35603 = DSM 2933 TaxID=398512 RepID=A0A0L6JHA7_9FIRM|nr:Ada metal-binding domain-containing protein [Pseudobacteroides cellulosolvens]KNY24857.1 Ada metal-binding domain-containing protein [Pseudobacteroides cellulosolvens ATCC 35603 = DSM 2933]